MIKIYTDGAYSSLRSSGGWAFVILKNDKKIYRDSDIVIATTNNRMEIVAAMEAIKWLIKNNIKEATIYTDSMYLIGTITKNWKKNKNVDLWEEIFPLVEKVNLSWQHVKGHSGDKWNNYVDMLAVHASHLILNE